MKTQRADPAEPRRWPWQDPYSGEVTAGWAMVGVAALLSAVSLLVYWLNDMHMYRYGLFGR